MGETGGACFYGTKFAHQNGMQIGIILISADNRTFLPRIYSFRDSPFRDWQEPPIIAPSIDYDHVCVPCTPHSRCFPTILGQMMD